jgi:hypothetical protein
MTKIQNPKQKTQNSKRVTFNGLDFSVIGVWNLFGVWNLRFGI